MSKQLQKIVILIGPYGSGKTKIAEMFRDRLEWTRSSVDEKYYHCLKQIAPDGAQVATSIDGLPRSSLLRQEYDIKVIEKVLQTALDSGKDCVIDFGADHSLYPDEEFLAHARKLLSPYDVVLLLPSLDLEESCRILLHRIRSHGLKGRNLADAEIIKWVRDAMQQSSNQQLAKYTVYNKDHSPEDTFHEICRLLGVNLR